MTKWIFFDVGSTLVDETKAYDHRVYDMIAGTDITFKAFDDVRMAFARQGLDGNASAILHFGLTKPPWHSEDEVPYPDAYSTLSYLRKKGYRLGIIANQNPGTEKRLEDWGLRQFFDVICASAEMGCAKPDKRIFEKAFELAECTAEESAMVGDRLDNDIIPAKALGMKTVWVKSGFSKYVPSAFGEGYADFEIASISELMDIQKGNLI